MCFSAIGRRWIEGRFLHVSSGFAKRKKRDERPMRQKKVSPKMTHLKPVKRKNLWINTVHRLVKSRYSPLKTALF
jgi:hypothetical protein